MTARICENSTIRMETFMNALKLFGCICVLIYSSTFALAATLEIHIQDVLDLGDYENVLKQEVSISADGKVHMSSLPSPSCKKM